MANKKATTPRGRVILETPAGRQALDRLAELEATETEAALKLLALKREEAKIVALGRRVEDERLRIFGKLLTDRGFAPDTPTTIDSKTGKLTIVDAVGRRTHPQ